MDRFPTDPRYHSSLAIVYAGLGRQDEAVRSARKAVELLPMTIEAMRGAYAVEALARVYAMTGATAALRYGRRAPKARGARVRVGPRARGLGDAGFVSAIK